MKSISFVLILFLLFTIPGYCIVPFFNKSENSSHHKWHLIWSDEFKTNQSIDKKWDAQNSSEGDILCSRWRENAIIKKHALRIINKKENKGGKNWTSARLISKEQFKYGYFECKMKISQSTGINNAFWFYSYPKGNEESFEIDGAEVITLIKFKQIFIIGEILKIKYISLFLKNTSQMTLICQKNIIFMVCYGLKIL